MTPATCPSHPDALRLEAARQLAQLIDLVDALASRDASALPAPVGAHLRHVIEHLEALLLPAMPGRVAYDARVRDARLEREPQVALARLRALKARVALLAPPALDTPLELIGLTGLEGEMAFRVPTTLGRELAFVASHTVHHFALLRPHLERLGLALDERFGLAPATVAHARAQAAAVTDTHWATTPA